MYKSNLVKYSDKIYTIYKTYSSLSYLDLWNYPHFHCELYCIHMDFYDRITCHFANFRHNLVLILRLFLLFLFLNFIYAYILIWILYGSATSFFVDFCGYFFKDRKVLQRVTAFKRYESAELFRNHLNCWIVEVVLKYSVAKL